MREEQIKNGNIRKATKTGKPTLKMLLPELKDMLTNWTFFFNTLAQVAVIWYFGAIISFYPKILLLKFGVTSEQIGYILGAALAPSIGSKCRHRVTVINTHDFHISVKLYDNIFLFLFTKRLARILKNINDVKKDGKILFFKGQLANMFNIKIQLDLYVYISSVNCEVFRKVSLGFNYLISLAYAVFSACDAFKIDLIIKRDGEWL